MAFEIVDGMTGTKHISSDDLSALNIATIGKADCVLEYGDNFKLTMASANSATLGTGVGMVGGKRFWNQAATSLTVQSGTQGQKRNDLVVARYAKTGAGVESITPVVIKGTPSTGAAADPTTTSNDLKLWRIPLNGISVGTPVKLFDTVTSLATLGDSVYQDTGNVYLYKDPTWGYISYRAKGGICTLIVAGVGGIAANGSWTVQSTIPRKFMPDENTYAPLCHRQTDHMAQIWIPGKNYENGNLIIYSALDTTGTSTRISGILSWAY